MTRQRVPNRPNKSSQRSRIRVIRFTHESNPASSSALIASPTVEGAQSAFAAMLLLPAVGIHTELGDETDEREPAVDLGWPSMAG